VPLFGLSMVVVVIENAHRLVRQRGRADPARRPARPVVLTAAGVDVLRGRSRWVPFAYLAPAVAAATYSLATLFFTFLKIGAPLYAAVMCCWPFCARISSNAWLADRQQIVDAVAVGQFTPARCLPPRRSSATWSAACRGDRRDRGRFLPSFVFVAIVYSVVCPGCASRRGPARFSMAPTRRRRLMIAVTWQLGMTSVVDLVTAALA